jgi:hypothetical protein
MDPVSIAASLISTIGRIIYEAQVLNRIIGAIQVLEPPNLHFTLALQLEELATRLQSTRTELEDMQKERLPSKFGKQHNDMRAKVLDLQFNSCQGQSIVHPQKTAVPTFELIR